MSDPNTPCSAFEDVDLAAYVIEPDSSEWTQFREHFPSCEECSAALRSWSELEWDLGEIGVGLGSHPSTDELDLYAGGRQAGGATLLASDRTRIESHLAECATCSDEMRALARFRAGSPARQAAETTSPMGGASLWSRVRDVFGGAGWAPAVGMAAIGLLLGWWFLSGRAPIVPQETAPQVVETRETQPLPPTPLEPDASEQGTPSETPDEASRLARSEPEQVQEGISELAAVVPESERAADTTPTSPLRPEPGDGVVPETIATPESGASEPLEGASYEVLLASLDLDPVLAYRAQAGMGGAGRMDLIGRSGTTASAEAIQVVAPQDHAARSGSPHPLLIFSLSEDVSPPIEIQIVDDRAIDPVLRLILEGPHEAGLHAIDLEERGIELDRDVPYLWSAAILVDPDRPSRNPRSRATLVVPPGALAPSEESTRGALAAGYWYDGLGELARARAAHPESERISGALAKLLEQQSVRHDASLRVEIR